MKRVVGLFFLLAVLQVDAKLQVVALHPFMGDLARNIGGEYVEVVDLMPIGESPHNFEPLPQDMRRIAEADIVLASGKYLEKYLDKVRDNLADGAILLEVGRKIPSCLIESGSALFACCPAHSVGAIDPHWWHSIKGMRRGTKIILREFSRFDPAHKEDYKAHSRAYDQKLSKLYQWAKKEVAKIPRSRRYLFTSHAAFGYLCKEFGFRSIPLQGQSKEQTPTPKYLAEVIENIHRHKVSAVFHEDRVNPKVMDAMVKEAGIKVGGVLLADSPDEKNPTYIQFFTHNIKTIVKALSP